jgi:hypothetical protein
MERNQGHQLIMERQSTVLLLLGVTVTDRPVHGGSVTAFSGRVVRLFLDSSFPLFCPQAPLT